MSTHDRLREIVEPIVDRLGLELFDLHYTGSTLSVLVDRPRRRAAPPGSSRGGDHAPEPPTGIDLEAITAVTKAVSRALDEADPIPGHYALEVSSPGLERPLRTPAHYAGAVGETVSIKTAPGYDGPRRLKGLLVRAGPEADAGQGPAGTIDLCLDEPPGEIRTVAYTDIEKGRTVFEWGPEPKPTRGGGKGRSKPSRAQGANPAGRSGRDEAATGRAGKPGARPQDAPPPAGGTKTPADEKKVTAP